MQCLKWFLDHGVDINKRCDKRNITPLSCAVRYALMAIVQLLFEYGGKVDSGQLLHYAAFCYGLEEDDSKVLRYVYDKDPSSWEKINKILDQDDKENYTIYEKSGLGTPLHYAADVGSTASVRFLLEKGADRTIKDPFRMTLLDVAVSGGYEDVVELLKSKNEGCSSWVAKI